MHTIKTFQFKVYTARLVLPKAYPCVTTSIQRERFHSCRKFPASPSRRRPLTCFLSLQISPAPSISGRVRWPLFHVWLLWLLRLSIRLRAWSKSLLASGVHFFLWLISRALQAWTTLCFPAHLWKHIWVVPSLGLMGILVQVFVQTQSSPF